VSLPISNGLSLSIGQSEQQRVLFLWTIMRDEEAIRDKMDGDRELAGRYRTRAAEVRIISATLNDLDHRKTLNAVATDYEQMAMVFEEIADKEVRHMPPFDLMR